MHKLAKTNFCSGARNLSYLASLTWLASDEKKKKQFRHSHSYTLVASLYFTLLYSTLLSSLQLFFFLLGLMSLASSCCGHRIVNKQLRSSLLVGQIWTDRPRCCPLSRIALLSSTTATNRIYYLAHILTANTRTQHSFVPFELLYANRFVVPNLGHFVTCCLVSSQFNDDSGEQRKRARA